MLGFPSALRPVWFDLLYRGVQEAVCPQSAARPQRPTAYRWPIIKSLIDDGLDTFEVVNELNRRGLKTGTGLRYSYKNLRKLIRRKGYMPPRKKPGNEQAKLHAFFVRCQSEGLSSRQAIEKAIAEDVVPADDTMARKRFYDRYYSFSARGAVIENIPEDFRSRIDSLVGQGLDGPRIADELNRLGLKTFMGKPYRSNTVQKYCIAIGISLKPKRYLDDPVLKKEVLVFLDAGKSCKQIAEHLNEHGFKTFLSRPFEQEDIRSMLGRQAMKANAHCRYEYILKEIGPLAEAGYHPRTISGKLNSMGLKTVTASRFNTRIVEHYLRLLKNTNGQSK